MLSDDWKWPPRIFFGFWTASGATAKLHSADTFSHKNCVLFYLTWLIDLAWGSYLQPGLNIPITFSHRSYSFINIVCFKDVVYVSTFVIYFTMGKKLQKNVETRVKTIRKSNQISSNEDWKKSPGGTTLLF